MKMKMKIKMKIKNENEDIFISVINIFSQNLEILISVCEKLRIMEYDNVESVKFANLLMEDPRELIYFHVDENTQLIQLDYANDVTEFKNLVICVYDYELNLIKLSTLLDFNRNMLNMNHVNVDKNIIRDIKSAIKRLKQEILTHRTFLANASDIVYRIIKKQIKKIYQSKEKTY